MQTLGFVGTAKNTGKTTAALHMLALVDQAGIKTGLTSIGYDGENTDHVTGLPKPRYYAHPGMVIATADNCLELGTARTIHRQPTGIRTILGEIIIAEVAEPGFVVLAGPNRRIDLQILLEQLQAQGIQLTLVDGALNRLAALVLADGMVLSTGAAFDERIDILVEHAAAMESLFHFPLSPLDESCNEGFVCCKDEAGNILHQLPTGSVTDEPSMQLAARWLQESHARQIIVPGVFYPPLFEAFIKVSPDHLADRKFVFTSPLSLLATGSPKIWQESFQTMTGLGAEVAYRRAIPLHFMTVNPFYPRYLQKTGAYIAEFVDRLALLRAAREKIVHTLVIDVLQPPHPDLLAQCGLQTVSSGEENVP